MTGREILFHVNGNSYAVTRRKAFHKKPSITTIRTATATASTEKNPKKISIVFINDDFDNLSLPLSKSVEYKSKSATVATASSPSSTSSSSVTNGSRFLNFKSNSSENSTSSTINNSNINNHRKYESKSVGSLSLENNHNLAEQLRRNHLQHQRQRLDTASSFLSHSSHFSSNHRELSCSGNKPSSGEMIKHQLKNKTSGSGNTSKLNLTINDIYCVSSYGNEHNIKSLLNSIKKNKTEYYAESLDSNEKKSLNQLSNNFDGQNDSTSNINNSNDHDKMKSSSLKLEHFKFSSSNKALSVKNDCTSNSNAIKNSFEASITAIRSAKVKSKQLAENKMSINKLDANKESTASNNVDNEASFIQPTTQSEFNANKLSYLKKYVANGLANKSSFQFYDGHWNKIPGSKLRTTTIKTPLNYHSSNSHYSAVSSASIKLQQQQYQKYQNYSKENILNAMPPKLLSNDYQAINASTTQVSSSQSSSNLYAANNGTKELSVIDLKLPVKTPALSQATISSDHSAFSSNSSRKKLSASSNCETQNAGPSSNQNKSNKFNENSNNNNNKIILTAILKPKLNAADYQDMPYLNYNKTHHQHNNFDFISKNNDFMFDGSIKNKNYLKYVMNHQKKKADIQQQQQTSNCNMTTFNINNKKQTNLFHQEIPTIASSLNNISSNALLIRRLRF